MDNDINELFRYVTSDKIEIIINALKYDNIKYSEILECIDQVKQYILSNRDQYSIVGIADKNEDFYDSTI